MRYLPTGGLLLVGGAGGFVLAGMGTLIPIRGIAPSMAIPSTLLPGGVAITYAPAG